MARMFSSCFFQRGGSQCAVFSCGTLPSLSYSTFSCLLLRLCEDRVGASVSGLSALPKSAPEAKHNTWLQCRFARQKVLIDLAPYTFHCYIQWLLMSDRRSTVSNGQPDKFYGGYNLHLLKNKLKAQIVTQQVCCVFRIGHFDKHYLRSSPPPPPISLPQKKKPDRLSRAEWWVWTWARLQVYTQHFEPLFEWQQICFARNNETSLRNVSFPSRTSGYSGRVRLTRS